LRRIAHDIASPTGVTLTVLEELASADRPRPELVAMARRSLRRLMRLSEHLALVAELESGTLEPEIAVIDVRALTKQALEDAVAIDGRKDVVATCDLPAVPHVISGDARLLVVVMREVIGNALKLASSRVEVSVTATSDAIDGGGARSAEHPESRLGGVGGQSPPAAIVLRVDDDGPGFPEEARATLGKRFVRRGSARGLGLSLSMAVEILGEHGGKIEIEQSKLPPGRRGTTGSAVLVTLPMRAAAAAR
jgi:signal transduction histidine kinase